MKKKLWILVSCVFALFYVVETQAQYRYKVEYDIEWLSVGTRGYRLEVRLVTANTFTSPDRVLFYNVSGCVSGIETDGMITGNRIINSANLYTHINRNITANTGPSQPCNTFPSPTGNYRIPFGCYAFNSPEMDNLFPNNPLVTDFSVYRIEPLADLNGTGITFPECESQTIRISNTSCSRARYAVQYQIGSSSVWQTLRPYGSRSTAFSIQKSDFPTLDNYESLRLRVQYTDSGTIEYSDVVSYSYVPCPPNIQGSPVATNTTCFDSTDGGVTLNFDRALQPDEEFRFTLSGITPEGFTIPEQDFRTTAGGTSFTWPNGLGAGTYTVSYQTFFLQNNTNPNDDVPTAAASTANFTISRPSEVTVGLSSVIQPQCSGDTGSVTLSAGGGQTFESGTYQYSSNNGSTWQASPTFNGLNQGQNYTFRSRLALSGNRFCVSPGSQVVAINAVANPLVINAASATQQPTFAGATNGSILVTLNNLGGSPAFRYEALTGGANGTVRASANTSNRFATLAGLGAGIYTIKVIDTNGCEAVFPSTITLTEPSPIRVTSISSTAISCFNATDGSLTANPSGGNVSGIGDYRYRWTRQGDAGFLRTTRTITNLSAGVYTVTITDLNNNFTDPNTSASRSATLTNPTQVTISSAVGNDISCNGAADGSISVTATGGTLPYSYRFGTSNTFITLGAGVTSWNIPVTSPGSYSLSVRDANNCRVDLPTNILIDEPGIISINEIIGAHVDNTVFGGTDGILEINVVNNQDPTTYNWFRNGSPFSPPAGSTNTRLINLPAGSYTVNLRDTNGCTASIATPIIITEPGPLVFDSVVDTDISCNGLTDGSITATVSGGTEPYTYTWSLQGDPGFSAPNSPSISGLASGVYELTVTDDVGTNIQTTATITEPAALVLGASQVDNLCFGESSGSIDLNVSGGTPPYNYLWNIGATTQDLNSLPAGSYSVTVTDTNGCSAVYNTNITQPGELIITPTVTNITGFGTDDGAIAISVTGGNPGYTYQWIADNGFTASQANISGLAPGRYTLTVTDANYTASGNEAGCAAVAVFDLAEPGELVANITETNALGCFGDTDGSLRADVVGGVAPYNYQWFQLISGNPVLLPVTSQVISGLSAGQYQVEVTDTNGIQTVSPIFDLTEPSLLSASINSQTDLLCFNEPTGAIDVTVTGGTPPYTYSWSNGATTEDLNTIPAGNYSVLVTDSNSCETSVNTTITEPEEIVIGNTVTNITGFGTNDGAISINVTGGTGTYTYEWFADNGFTSTNASISGLSPGRYTLVVTDGNYTASGDLPGCSQTIEIVLTEPGQLQVAIIEVFDLLCNGDTNAELFADVTGGVAPYSYQWYLIDNGNPVSIGQNTDFATDLGEGSYQVQITDTNGIQTTSLIFDITAPPALVITLDNLTEVLCFGENTGSIETTISGGTPPYLVEWNTGSTTDDLSNLTAGTYTLTVVDDFGCVASQTYEVRDLFAELLLSDVQLTNVSSYEGTDGRIEVTIEGGSQPYLIEWIRLSDNSSIGNSNLIDNLTADDYQLNITDAAGCTISETYTITQPDIVEATLLDPICIGDCNGSIEVVVNRGNGSFTYSWESGETTSSLSGLCAGSYTVTIDGFGNGPLTRTYVLEDPQPLAIELGEDITLCQGQSVMLSALIDDPDASYLWTSGNGFTSTNAQPVVDEAGTYTVTVTNNQGCTGTDSIDIFTSDREISAVFLAATQVFTNENLVAIDVSSPVPDSVEWLIPEGAVVVTQNQDFVELYFEDPGTYNLSMLTRLGDCQAIQTKSIIVLEAEEFEEDDKGEGSVRNIQEFITFPNPSDGRFATKVVLKDAKDISLKVFSLANNRMLDQKTGKGNQSYEIAFDLSNMPSGMYAVLLETPYGNAIRKIIIQ
ncbi:T9SS type A sorting domain-containing protein [Flavobacteriaceae bacterium M23B6Z8]